MSRTESSIVILFCTLSINVMTSQLPHGDWIKLQSENNFSTPKSNIISFERDSVVYFDFLTPVLKKSYSQFLEYSSDIDIKKNQHLLLDYFTFQDDNTLILKGLYFKDTDFGIEDLIVEEKYVFLEPTEVLAIPQEIEDRTYQMIKDDGSSLNIEFGNKLIDEVYNFDGYTIGNLCLLEKRKDTFFITVYIDDELINGIPIKRLSKDFLEIYGLYEGPVMAVRIN